jgi:hypothetical protein
MDEKQKKQLWRIPLVVCSITAVIYGVIYLYFGKMPVINQLLLMASNNHQAIVALPNIQALFTDLPLIFLFVSLIVYGANLNRLDAYSYSYVLDVTKLFKESRLYNSVIGGLAGVLMIAMSLLIEHRIGLFNLLAMNLSIAIVLAFINPWSVLSELKRHAWPIRLGTKIKLGIVNGLLAGGALSFCFSIAAICSFGPSIGIVYALIAGLLSGLITGFITAIFILASLLFKKAVMVKILNWLKGA